MSGAQMLAFGAAHFGRVPVVKPSPVCVQDTRSLERATGIRCGVPSPSRSGSDVPYAYHQPSLPRITEGSANVSAKVRLTGLTYGVRWPGGAGAAVAAGMASIEPAVSEPVAMAVASAALHRERPRGRTAVCVMGGLLVRRLRHLTAASQHAADGIATRGPHLRQPETPRAAPGRMAASGHGRALPQPRARRLLRRPLRDGDRRRLRGHRHWPAGRRPRLRGPALG